MYIYMYVYMCGHAYMHIRMSLAVVMGAKCNFGRSKQVQIHRTVPNRTCLHIS